MTVRIKFIAFFLIAAGCVDPYQFRITDQTAGIAVDAYLSDQSFNDSRSFPSDGRYFYVRLSRTSDVINTRSEKISGALVVLENRSGETWTYDESAGEAGTYLLMNDDFSAQDETEYRLTITTPDDEQITSAWQALPEPVTSMGEISFRQSTLPTKVLDQVVPKRGVVPFIRLPENPTKTPAYYRWTFDPTWVFIAALLDTSNANYRCFASNIYYIPNFSLLRDVDGGYNKDFYFIATDENERILHEFSMLIEQQAMTEEFYNYWREMQELNQTDGIFSQPPYNLKTNYTSANGTKVFGYFGVVRSQAKRWYFNRGDLSYLIPEWWSEVCAEPCMGCPPPPCLDCMRYEIMTSITNRQPEWWGR